MQSNSSFAPLDRRAATSDSFYMAIAAANDERALRPPIPGPGARPPVRRYFSEAALRPIDRRRWAEVLERNIGQFRIYAGALDAPEGGYTAAVEVHRVREGSDTADIIFSNDQIAGDFRFEVPASALRHALDIGHQAIRLREGLRS